MEEIPMVAVVAAVIKMVHRSVVDAVGALAALDPGKDVAIL